jgi:DNA-binding PadR family transcriptional regulator
MKGDRLGEFEELTLMALCAIADEAYAVPVQQFIERSTGRAVAMGAVYAALDRLEDKGFVRSYMGEATQVRGGKARRHFEPTADGRKTLRELRRVRERIWRTIDSRGNA